jgi:hypothetical protein
MSHSIRTSAFITTVLAITRDSEDDRENTLPFSGIYMLEAFLHDLKSIPQLSKPPFPRHAPQGIPAVLPSLAHPARHIPAALCCTTLGERPRREKGGRQRRRAAGGQYEALTACPWRGHSPAAAPDRQADQTLLVQLSVASQLSEAHSTSRRDHTHQRLRALNSPSQS